MADEFIKGLGILTGSGLAWLVLASWCRTTSFESIQQLIAPLESDATEGLFSIIGVTLMDVFLRFALPGALTFWVLVPAGHQITDTLQKRRNAQ